MKKKKLMIAVMAILVIVVAVLVVVTQSPKWSRKLQEQLAGQLGVSRQAISKWESGDSHS